MPTSTISRPKAITVTASQAVLSLAEASGSAGGEVPIFASLTGGQDNLAAVGATISYDPTVLRVKRIASDDVDCTVAGAIGDGTSADKVVDAQIVSTAANLETIKVIVLAFDNFEPIPDGPVFSCIFEILPEAQVGNVADLALDADASDLLGQDATIAGAGSTVSITVAAPVILAGNPSGAAGSNVSVQASLENASGIVATATDITYDTELVRVVLDGDTPDCTIDAAIADGTTADKEAIEAQVIPGEGSFATLRVGVLSYENFNPIPNGALFACTFEIDPSAPPGATSLVVTAAASDENSDEVEVGGVDGSITVLP